MKLEQIRAMMSPVAIWTGERYNGDNVYDDMNTWTLINSNATLGEDGQVSTNFSGKSINLKGGHLTIPDADFLTSEINSRQFTISLSFKVTDTIVGFTPIISKWEPEQQFVIGFENDRLMMKVRTDSALLETEYSDVYNPIIKSGRWNWLIFEVTSTTIKLYLNGNVAITLTNSESFATATNTVFQVGASDAEVLTTDFWVNDISISTKYNGYYPETSYIFPRNDQEMYLDLAPEYYFPIIEQFKINSEMAIPNLGSKGGVGYLVAPDGGSFTLSKPTNIWEKEAVQFPANSWLTIDQDLTFDFSSGKYVSFVFQGQFDNPSGSTYLNRLAWRYMDVRGEKDNNANRIIMSHEHSSTTYNWTGLQLYDGAGSLYKTIQGDSDLDRSRANYNSSLGIQRHYLTADAMSYQYWYYYNWDYAEADTLTGIGNVNSATFKSNKFLYNTNAYSCSWGRCSNFALIYHYVHAEWVDQINYPRVMLFHYFTRTDHTQRLAQYGVYNQTTPNWKNYRNGPSYYLDTNGSFNYNTSIHDPLSNKQNEWTGSLYLAQGDWMHQHYRESLNYAQKNNFTTMFFVRNMNTTTNDTICRLTYTYNNNNSQNTVPDSSDKFTIRMNQRDGAFSVGDVEIGYGNLATNYKISTSSQKFTDEGWHHLAWVRNGVRNELWIDGLLEEVLITPSVYDMGSSYYTWGLRGNDNHISEWVWVLFASTQQQIEWYFKGFADIIEGQTLLDGVGLASKMLAVKHSSGHVISTNATDADGHFRMQLPKSSQYTKIDVLALPQDEGATNNVVIHGPYDTNATYSKYVDEVLDQSLKDMTLDFQPMAYYPMDELSGTTIVDASGNSMDGTISGSGYLLNQGGMNPDTPSIYFEGVDSFIDLPDGFADFTGGMTIEVWAKSTVANSYEELFVLSQGVLDAYDETILFQRISTSNDFEFYQKNAGVIERQTLTYGFEENIWKSYIVRLQSDGTIEIFINGVVALTATATIPVNAIRTYNMIAGTVATGASNFEGNLSNIAVYDFALSDEELDKHVKRGFMLNTKTLKSLLSALNPDAYWTFDRLSPLEDEEGHYDFTATGTYSSQKNALVLNDGVIGNNYLYTADAYLGMKSTNTHWSLTISAKNSSVQQDGILCAQWDQSLDTGVFKLEIDNSTKYVFYMADGATFLTSTTSYNDGKWHFITVTYDGDVTRLYVDGVEEASVSNTHIFDASMLLTVGNDSTADANHFLEARTDIDDFALYSREISPVNVTTLYEQFQKKKDLL